jgi:tetratricopeptide (TPR) repeat protein
VYFVILLSLLLAVGCSADPRVQADRAIQQANEDITAHDELFDEARAAYSDAQQTIRETNENSEDSEGDDSDGGSPDSESTNDEGTAPESQAAESISEARGKLRDARSRLEEARGEISGIQDLEVSDDLLEYSQTLEDAISAQMRAEKREISFYEILAEDPGLEENREQAMELLEEASKSYTEAENGYQEANSLADSNPELVAPESGS